MDDQETDEGAGVTEETIDADKAAVLGADPPSAKIKLTRALIVATAVDYIDENGLADLSMRQLATRIGTEPMSLYRHVAGREDLLDAVVERLIDGMQDDEDVLERPQFGWQDFLQRLAHGIRRVAIAHPKAFPLVASRPVEAPWLRPPLRSLKWVDIFLRGLVDEGFSRPATLGAYRAFTSFLLGHLLLDVAANGADLGPLDVVEEKDEERLEPYPMVRDFKTGLTEDHSATEFEESLENLLDRLQLIKNR